LAKTSRNHELEIAIAKLLSGASMLLPSTG
jgi:hypothetical protein